jgi:hypothetical protein
LDYVFK